MSDLKMIWLCTQVNFQKWPVTPRIYTIAAVIIAFSIWVFSWISEYAAAVDVHTAPWVFPFLLTYGAMYSVYGCLTALLFCDAPFMDSHSSFLIIRTSRSNWIKGQLLYIVLASFVYTLFFWLMSILVLIPNVQFSMDWGAVLNTLAFDLESPTKYNISIMAVVGGQVMSMFSAIEATLISFGLFWLVSVFIGVLIFCFNIVFGKMIGLIAAGFFTFLATLSIYIGKFAFGNAIYYVSPINWSNMYFLDWGGTGTMPSPMYAVGCLLGAIVLMSIISILVFCKKDIHIQIRRS